MNKVLILGDGLLGTELIKQTSWDYTSRKNDGFDINNVSSWNFTSYNVIVNCIANTNTYSDDKDAHINVNCKFVNNLIHYCNDNNMKLIHISTDYVYANSVSNASEIDVPVHLPTWYGYSKLLGDGMVQLLSKNYLICRCTHKKNPFPYNKAWINQIGNFDYVDVIASKIISMINKDLSGLYNVGTELKTMYELASTTKKVEPAFSSLEVPNNVSMNISKLNNDITSESKPFFSICIPTYSYNGKGVEFLKHSFDILTKQTFKDFEIIISDHSTDDYIKEVCEQYKNLPIKYIKNEHGRGVISPNLNVCLKNSIGKWIKILFQDDFLYNEKSLQVTSDFIKNNIESCWIATRFYHSNDGVQMYRDFVPSWNNDMWKGNNTIGCPSVITIKNEDIILFDEDLNWLMDVDYYQKMHERYGSPDVIFETTVVNRTAPERLSNRINDESKNDEYLKLVKRYDI